MSSSLPIDKYVAEHFRQQQQQIELQQQQQQQQNSASAKTASSSCKSKLLNKNCNNELGDDHANAKPSSKYCGTNLKRAYTTKNLYSGLSFTAIINITK